MISTVATFALGSGISGGATTTAMLIGGRAVQGVGGGGINMLIDLIVCDLVPLRERGNFMGIIFGVFAIGTSLGPFIGGAIVQNTTWRWVFYLNLPIAGAALVLLLLFLPESYEDKSSFSIKIKRVDFVGNAILLASVTSILIALSTGGTRYGWGDWHVIVPLVLGLVGLVGLFPVYETFATEPAVPMRLFSNRTSATALGLTFVHIMFTFWVVYFLPVYFQSVLAASPTRSGVLLLPTVISVVPIGLISGLLLAKFGRYKPLHIAGFAIMTIGIGCFTTLDASSSLAVYVILQIVVGGGSGLILTTLLPAVQAPLPETDTALATATWAFIRSFGSIWGVSIPAAIFNTYASKYASRITDLSVRAQMSGGNAYAHASKEFINSFQGSLRDEVLSAFTDSLKVVWQVAIGIVGLAFLLSFLEKEIKLREELDTEYGLEKKEIEICRSDELRFPLNLIGKASVGSLLGTLLVPYFSTTFFFKSV
jgi:MFS family permease